MIPKKLKIGGHIYKITFDKSEDAPCGKCKRTNSEIIISGNITKSHQEATLLHEILHAINNELNETILDSLAEQLYQVLKDNKLNFLED